MVDIYTLLEFEEGRRRIPYPDTKGYMTGGVGHKMSLREQSIYQGRIIPNAVVDNWLINDVSTATRAAEKYPWYYKLNEPRKAVVVSMIFQMGEQGFSNFKKTISFLSSGNYQAAATEMLDSVWAKKDSPNRARRHVEQMASGEWCKEYFK